MSFFGTMITSVAVPYHVYQLSHSVLLVGMLGLDSLRGRLASIELLSYSVAPTLGNFDAGVVASLTSIRLSIVAGGVLCVAAAAVRGGVARLPHVRRAALPSGAR